MSNINKNFSEDDFTDIDFDDDEDELKNSQFVEGDVEKVEMLQNKEEKRSLFYGENDKLLGEKIIEKKSGAIIEIKYGLLGQKISVTEWDKNKNLKKATDYYENGQVSLVTTYGAGVSYKSMKYGVDGTRISFVEKYTDGTAQAQYYDADGKGNGTIFLKLDADKNVIDKRVEY